MKSIFLIRLRLPFLAAGLLLAPFAQSLNLKFEHVFTQEHARQRPLGPVSLVAQDHKGLMWFAGREGIFRYDGNDVVSYSGSGNDSCSAMVEGLAVDLDGVIWTATHAGLCRYDPLLDRFLPFSLAQRHTDPLKQARTYAVYAAPDNRLFVGLAGALVMISADRSRMNLFRTSADQGGDSRSNNFLSFFYESDTSVWVGTRESGLAQFNPETGSFRHFRHDPNNPSSISGDDIKMIKLDRKNRLWIGTFMGGLSRLDTQRRHFTRYAPDPADPLSIGNGNIWGILVDSEGAIWLSSDGAGLLRYDEQQDNFVHYRNDPNDSSSLMFDKTVAVFEDRDQNIWVTTYPWGVELYNRKLNKITRYQNTGRSPHSLNDSGILSVFADRDNQLWIGTEAGLNRFLPQTGQFLDYSAPGNGWHVTRSPITRIRQDATGNLWLGTWGNGLFVVDTAKQKVEHWDAARLGSAMVWDILLESDGVLVATQGGGLLRLDPRTGEISKFPPARDRAAHPQNYVSAELVYSLLRDKRGNLWIGTVDGLDLWSEQTRSMRHFSSQQQPVGATINSQRIRSLYEDYIGRIWIGTEDRGVFVYTPATGMFANLSREEGLPSSEVTATAQDPDNNIWLFTTNGLVKVDPVTFALQVFTSSHGLTSGHINRGAGYIDASGTVYAGSTSGLNIFQAAEIASSRSAFPVHITDFRLFNRPVDIGGDSPLQRAMLETTELTLDHRHSVFSFSFAAVSYSMSHWNQYAYRLRGFDRDWNYVGTNTSATYTNIPPGDYLFEVKAQNSDGIWSNITDNVRLRVRTPPWASWWAYCLYVLLAVGLGLAALRVKSKQLELKKEKTLNTELLRLNEIKDAFLANTSHELRTPLNGIIGLAEGLKDHRGSAQEYKRRLDLIISSSRRLSALVNDILDYSKLTDHNLELYREFIELQTLVDDVFSITAPLAQDKNIDLQNRISPSAPPVYADANRLQQILINLISNGIKYSSGGFVKVSSLVADDYFVIAVEDSGIGISQEQLSTLFHPFNQLESSHNYRIGGTGLGLAVTKNLIELHGGHIQVRSELQQGSQFFVSLPHVEQPQATGPVTLPTGTPSPAPSVQVLIADDDPVNRMILSESLRTEGYQVVEANDGESALAAFAGGCPFDLVILDVMMPKLDGFSAARELRRRFPAADLPLIFLSANVTSRDRQLCAELQAQFILLKPTPKEQLLQAIHQALHPAQQQYRAI